MGNTNRINDSYAHAAGDHVLVNVANLLQGVLREYDVVARWGGRGVFIAVTQHGYNRSESR